MSLRERKKLRTRRLISDTARRLFTEHGFDAVPVSEIAREADVSEATVYNYFPTKEDLVYEGMERFEADMLRAVRERPPGESLIRAFGRYVLTVRGALAGEDPDAARSLVDVSRMIADSPTLRSRERQILNRYAESLSTLIAEETAAQPDDLRPTVIARALLGLHASLVTFVRRRILEDATDLQRIARDLRTEGEKALRLLERGLNDYDVQA